MFFFQKYNSRAIVYTIFYRSISGFVKKKLNN
jgi:hypothetical protein